MTSISVLHSYFLINFTLCPPLYVIYSQVNGLDNRRRKKMGEKLVMHCKWPKETTIKYNKYVVNGKLFHTLPLNIEKRN